MFNTDRALYYDFQCNNWNYKLLWIPPDTTPLTVDDDGVPNLEPFPDFLFTKLSIEAGYDDERIHGLPLATIMTIEMDLTRLDADVRSVIVNNKHSSWWAYKYKNVNYCGRQISMPLRNRWVLFSDLGEGATSLKDMYIMADCVQDIRPEKSIKYSQQQTLFQFKCVDLIFTVLDNIPTEITNADSIVTDKEEVNELILVDYVHNERYLHRLKGKQYVVTPQGLLEYSYSTYRQLYTAQRRTNETPIVYSSNPLSHWTFYEYAADGSIDGGAEVSSGVLVLFPYIITQDGYQGILFGDIKASSARDIMKQLLDTTMAKAQFSIGGKGLLAPTSYRIYKPLQSSTTKVALMDKDLTELEVVIGGKWISQCNVRQSVEDFQQKDMPKIEMQDEISYKYSLGNLSDDQDELEAVFTTQFRPLYGERVAEWEIHPIYSRLLGFKRGSSIYALSPKCKIDLGNDIVVETESALTNYELPSLSRRRFNERDYGYVLALTVQEMALFGFTSYLRAKASIRLYGNFNQVFVKAKTQIGTLELRNLGSAISVTIEGFDYCDIPDHLIISSMKIDYINNELEFTAFGVV